MREHAAACRHESRAVPPHRLIGSNVFGVHAPRFIDQRLLQLRQRPDPEQLKFLAHAANGPEQVHRGGPRIAHYLADPLELRLQLANRFRVGVLNPQRDSHGCCNPDSRRTTDHHVADRIRNLLVGLAGDVSFFSRQFGLIDEAHAGIGPFESLNHKN